MTESAYRSIGSILGLTTGIVLMVAFGFSGIIPGALFGAGGCVAGAITAEKLYAWIKHKGS